MMADWQPRLATVFDATIPLADEAEPTGAGAEEASAPPVPSLPIRLGDVLYAEMKSHVNSDETMPPIAEIVSGPLRGARLSGDFELREDKLVLAFKTLDFNGNTTAIDAFAVDEQLRQGIASEVNHRTFSRWAALVASGWLEGLQRYWFGSGTTIVIDGAVVDPRGNRERDFDWDDAARIAAGEIGRRTRSAATTYFNKPPTAQVYAGEAIGVLFIQSVEVPLAPGGPREAIARRPGEVR
jgi:intracellular multiplication protein IcmE